MKNPSREIKAWKSSLSYQEEAAAYIRPIQSQIFIYEHSFAKPSKPPAEFYHMLHSKTPTSPSILREKP